MIKDKERALKKALLYSYQAETAVLQDGRKFRCLINPDKIKMDYEDKIISIPFKDICLGYDNTKESGNLEQPVITGESKPRTNRGEEEIGMKPGDVFKWEETNSYWLVYLQRIEENAYFRAEIRRCRYEIEINDNKYKVYAAGPNKNNISWHTRRESGSWNDLDYDLTMFITSNEETRNYFHRFTNIELNNKPWEVQVVDATSTEGIIEIKLKEQYQNSIEKENNQRIKEQQKENNDNDVINIPYITGDTIVYPYDDKTYFINNTKGGKWKVDSNKVNIVTQTDTKVDINIVTGRKGNFNLIYVLEDKEEIKLPIKIESL